MGGGWGGGKRVGEGGRGWRGRRVGRVREGWREGGRWGERLQREEGGERG